MENIDTINLLRECDAGIKMAVASIDDVLDKTPGHELKRILADSKAVHEKLGADVHALLSRAGSEGKEPNAIAKSMSRIKTTAKMASDGSDATVADLITDGCDMGVKSLYRYLNQYKLADNISSELCMALASEEEKLRAELREYL